jgi:hypothetical protein
MMADQIRTGGNQSDFEFSPRLTIGYQHEDVGARVRYWHLDDTYGNDSFRDKFDVLDLDAYKQWDNIRAFGGLRVADVQELNLPNPDGYGTTGFGPTAGVEGETPIIGCLSANYGVRASILLADWYTGFQAGRHFSDTLFVPEVYTGLNYRWDFATFGARFEIQHWDSDTTGLGLNPLTIVGIGGTASVAW